MLLYKYHQQLMNNLNLNPSREVKHQLENCSCPVILPWAIFYMPSLLLGCTSFPSLWYVQMDSFHQSHLGILQAAQWHVSHGRRSPPTSFGWKQVKNYIILKQRWGPILVQLNCWLVQQLFQLSAPNPQ